MFADISAGASANFANYAGNVTVSAQPNITSVGTLTGLQIGGGLSVTGNIGAGADNTNALGFGGSPPETNATLEWTGAGTAVTRTFTDS